MNANECAFEALEAIRQSERDLCKRDVCEQCGGRALRYKRTVDGPNAAGNYTHECLDAPGRDALCRASSIFARENFGKPHKSKGTQ